MKHVILKSMLLVGVMMVGINAFAKTTPEEFKQLLKLAETGDSVAQYKVGWCYYGGDGGVKEDEKKGFEWHLKSAESGYAKAQYEVGDWYRFGRGVKEDLNKAFEWYMKSAEQSYPAAQCNVGDCYDDGIGVEQNLDKAFEWYLKSAELGYSRAQVSVGNYYRDGIVVEKDLNKAFEWYMKAAEQGHPFAQFNIGEFYDPIYAQQNYIVEPNLDIAMDWYYKATTNEFHPNYGAMIRLGYHNVFSLKDKEKGYYWYKKAAEEGANYGDDGTAYYVMGLIYKGQDPNFTGIVEPDKKVAMEWFEKAASNGYIAAQIEMGHYEIDNNKNIEKAIYWYKKAAEQGNSTAQGLLGVIYMGDERIEYKDVEKAVYWYTKSAEQGNILGQYSLGYIYFYGEGVPKDENKGLELITKSADSGYDQACVFMGSYYNKKVKGQQPNVVKAVKDKRLQELLKLSFHYYKIAADQEDPDAEAMVAWSYMYGAGVKKDVDQAYMWMARAARHGNEWAIEFCKEFNISY